MPNKNYQLNLNEFTQVKSAGDYATMRAIDRFCQLIESDSKPNVGDDSFSLHVADGPVTFAAEMSVWARGVGELQVMTKAAE